MHADLVGASGLDSNFQQRKFPVGRRNPLHHRVMRDRLTSSDAASRHAMATAAVASNRSVNGPLVALGPAMYQRDIFFLQRARRKLLRQLAMRFIALGDDDEAAGVFVQSVHDSRPQIAARL